MVHDLAHGRFRLVGDFDQIKTRSLSELKGFWQRHDSDLFPVGSDKSDLAGPDLFVHPGAGIS